MYIQRKSCLQCIYDSYSDKASTTGNSTKWNNRTLPGQMHLKGVQKKMYSCHIYMEKKIESAYCNVQGTEIYLCHFF